MKKNFSLDIANKTLTINSAFAEAIEMGEGADYQTYLRLMKDIPGLTVIRKTHATPRTYTSRATGEKFGCNQFKNLSYENMENFINGLPNNRKFIEAYTFIKYCGSLPLTSRYTAVRRWFVAQFPEFRKNPLFYLYNDVKVVDFKTIIQGTKEDIERDAEERGEEAS